MLVIKNLVVKDSCGIEAVKGLDLTVRHGEVVSELLGLTETDKSESDSSVIWFALSKVVRFI